MKAKIKSTKEGKLYYRKDEFWRDEDILRTIEILSKYKIVKGKLRYYEK
jgi:hypothetical protein